MPTTPALIPIYTTRGDLGGFLVYPYIYNALGEWIGWVTSERQVYSVHGHFVGRLSKDPRILRKRGFDFTEVRRAPPNAPPSIRPPAHVPLAPQMPELSLSEVDVLEEDPDLMPSLDGGDLREDMD
jgi:hypothetical protein